MVGFDVIYIREGVYEVVRVGVFLVEAGVESIENWVLQNRCGEVEVPSAVYVIRTWFCFMLTSLALIRVFGFLLETWD